MTIIFAVVSILTISCTSRAVEKEVVESDGSSPIKVIFETDMGNDVDDALALDMLYKYADQNKMEILAITVNKNNKYAPLFIDLMNSWYGYPDIPIGAVTNGAYSGDDGSNYAQTTWEYQVDGKRAFPGGATEGTQFPEAVDLYREVLSQQPKNSVTIVSVGFSTNLARLLDSPSDNFSELTGKDLVNEKVKLLSVMAGSFDENSMQEFNVKIDIKAAQKVFEEWPTQIVASPFELGYQIKYPASSIEKDFTWATPHPLVVAYENYLEMPYDRPTWDLTSMIYVLEGGSEFFTSSKNGQISVDDEGYTSFVETPDGKLQYLKVFAEQAAVLKREFIEIITTKPKNRD
ncbi:nucleoside hydrolase [uncultured Cyclobacterium sp.]|uniref:nucleoside hydrolase n=1 Tax=uncultured Cyclobacterium sp. TaxID=453820 RepID=UPI0030EE7B67|tara:strand:- start:39394 stop:40434 length:1041 start_codon:yes stop_codon:yes gene_type:complete